MPVIHTVEIVDFEYRPKDLVIQAGDTVQWTNRDASGHTATRAAAPTFDTGPLRRNETSGQITFPSASDAAGFEYLCSPHPFMKGRIIVTLPGTNSASYTLSAARARHEHPQSEEQ